MGKPLKKLGSFLKDNGLNLLGNVLGGASPVGAVVDMVFDGLGISSDKAKAMDESDTIALIQKDPQAFVKLREIETTHKVELEKLVLAEAQMYLTDIQSARAREMSVVSSTKKKDIFLYVFASLIVTGFFGLGVILFTVPLPEANGQGANIYIGACIGAFTGVVAYFFGSSAGSAKKTDIMANGKK